MKKLIVLLFVVSLFFISSTTKAQLIDEKNVTVTLDLQPVLQLNMTTSDQVEFVFDKISQYYSGITKYGATVLKVSASVSWDLYAVGTSQAATAFWDVQMQYNSTGGANAVSNIPLAALELRQYGANNYTLAATTAAAVEVDYSKAFPTMTYPMASPWVAPLNVGQNSIYHSATPYTSPGLTDKYIQGDFSTAVGTDGAPGGSYLTQGGTTSEYYFTIDYRILPGLPAIFPYAGNTGVAYTSEDIETVSGVTGSYAAPGIYTMNVKYILLEDQ